MTVIFTPNHPISCYFYKLTKRTWRVGEKNGGGMAKGTKLFTLGIYSG
jgi:hypothetical protein